MILIINHTAETIEDITNIAFQISFEIPKRFLLTSEVNIVIMIETNIEKGVNQELALTYLSINLIIVFSSLSSVISIKLDCVLLYTAEINLPSSLGVELAICFPPFNIKAVMNHFAFRHQIINSIN